MPGGDARLRREDRLLRARQFRRVTGSGRRAASRSFVLLATRREVPKETEQPLRGPRLGITASRRVGRAVRRNRAKRLIREWFRHARGNMPPDLDLVVIARPSAPGLHAREAGRELCVLLGRTAAEPGDER